MNYVHLSKKAFQDVFPRYFWQFFVFFVCAFVAIFCILYFRVCGNFLCKSQTFQNVFSRFFWATFCPGLDFRRMVAVEIRTSAFLFSTAAALVALTV